MPSLTELLELGAGPAVGSLRFDDLRQRAGRRRRRRNAARSAVGLVLVLCLVVTQVRRDDPPRRVVTADQPGGPGVFSSATGTVLVLDDGYDGIVLVDLDRRTVVRRVVEGQRAGDQPWRLFRAGDSLIVGWDDVYAVPLDGGPSRLLGRNAVAVPAGGDDVVWLVTSPPLSPLPGPRSLQLVDTRGAVLLRSDGPGLADAHAAGGIGETSMAFTTFGGLVVWDANAGDAGTVTSRLNEVPATYVSDTHGDRLAWCEAGCVKMHISDRDGHDLAVPFPEGLLPYGARSARFSPDGRTLAAIAGQEHALVLIDTATGAVTAVVRLAAGARAEPVSLSWSPDGSQVFASSSLWGSATATLARYVPATGEAETVSVPFGSVLGGIAVRPGEASALLDSPVGPADACRAPRVQPSGRTGPCAFAF